jgi:hypothetical protein
MNYIGLLLINVEKRRHNFIEKGENQIRASIKLNIKEDKILK